MKAIYNIICTTLTFAILTITTCGCSGNHTFSATEEYTEEHEHTEEIELSEKQMQTVGISLGHFEKREIGSSLKAVGTLTVNPQDIAEVTPLLSGIVKTIHVSEGQPVSKGTAIATIENLEILTLQQDYIEATAALKLAETEQTRQQRLAEEGAGIRKNMERAQSEYLVARSHAAALEQQLRTAGIDPHTVAAGKITTTAIVRSPISGVVNKIYPTTGSYADNSSPIATITDNSKTYATLRIYEKDLDKVAKGQTVDLSLTNSTGTFTGIIDEINPTIDADTRGINIKVRITDTKNQNLIPGMAVSAYINSGAHLSTVLPEAAVITNAGKSYIYVVCDTTTENGTKMYHFAPAEVITGSRQQGFIEVTPIEELPASATIVTDKAFYLASMTADHGEHDH